MKTESTETTTTTAETAVAGTPPGERSVTEAHAEVTGVSTLQKLLDLVAPENKPAASKLALKLMEEARSEGAPMPRKRAETPFTRQGFKASVPPPTKEESPSALPDAPKASPFKRTAVQTQHKSAFKRGHGL